MYTRDDFFQFSTDFSYFHLKFVFRKLLDTGQEQVKIDHFERGCTWFQLFFIDFSYFTFKPRSYLIYKCHFDLVQWNLSKPNLLGSSFCVQNRQVFGLYRLYLTKISYIETLFKVQFMQESVLFMVQFRQVYTGICFIHGSV